MSKHKGKPQAENRQSPVYGDWSVETGDGLLTATDARLEESPSGVTLVGRDGEPVLRVYHPHARSVCRVPRDDGETVTIPLARLPMSPEDVRSLQDALNMAARPRVHLLAPGSPMLDEPGPIEGAR